MTTSKKLLLIIIAAAFCAAAVFYRDYRWFLVASAVACTLRALVFTRRF